MRTSKRMRHSFIALAAVVGSLMAVSAAPAMGAVHWNDNTSGAKLSGSLTASMIGQTPKTCTAPATQQSIMGTSNAVIWSGNGLVFNCGGGQVLQIPIHINGGVTSVTASMNGIPGFTSPWGTFTSLGMTAEYANGTEGAPSTLTLSNDAVGYIGKESIYVDGVLNVTTSTGGLLTRLP